MCASAFLNEILACDAASSCTVQILRYLLTSGFMYGSIGIWS